MPFDALLLKRERGEDIEPTIHDLFNELHRRLCIECEAKPLNDTVPMQRIALEIEALHHDYTELTLI